MQRERSERYLRLSPFESVSVSRASSDSGAGTLENLTEAMDAASSNNSYVESIGPRSVDPNRALLNKRSILQVINNYIKAGIEEGFVFFVFFDLSGGLDQFSPLLTTSSNPPTVLQVNDKQKCISARHSASA